MRWIFFNFLHVGSVLTYSRERASTRLLRDDDGFLLAETSVSVCHSCVNSWLICSISLIYSRYLLTDSFSFSQSARAYFSLAPSCSFSSLVDFGGTHTRASLHDLIISLPIRESATRFNVNPILFIILANSSPYMYCIRESAIHHRCPGIRNNAHAMRTTVPPKRRMTCLS